MCYNKNEKFKGRWIVGRYNWGSDLEKYSEKTKKWYIRKKELDEQTRQSNIWQLLYILFPISVSLLLLTWNDILSSEESLNVMLFWVAILKVPKMIGLSYSLGPMLFFYITQNCYTQHIYLQKQHHPCSKPPKSHTWSSLLHTWLNWSQRAGAPSLWSLAVPLYKLVSIGI